MQIVLVGSSLDRNRCFAAVADSVADLRNRLSRTPWSFDADGDVDATEQEIEARISRLETFTIYDQSNWHSQDAVMLLPA